VWNNVPRWRRVLLISAYIALWVCTIVVTVLTLNFILHNL
jgi:hypothetical protein